MMMAQWRADRQSGESLTFENFKGGCFSTDGEYGLRVTGRSAQNTLPTPLSPAAIQKVKAGTTIRCTDIAASQREVTTPCDLYEGDVWYPQTGKVERHACVIHLTPDLNYLMYISGSSNRIYANLLDASEDHAACFCTHSATASAPGAPYLFVGANNTFVYWNNMPAYLGITTIAEFKTWLQGLEDRGESVYVVYRKSTPSVEQYEPQPLSAAAGTVNISQTPAELPASLSAALPVRR